MSPGCIQIYHHHATIHCPKCKSFSILSTKQELSSDINFVTPCCHSFVKINVC